MYLLLYIYFRSGYLVSLISKRSSENSPTEISSLKLILTFFYDKMFDYLGHTFGTYIYAYTKLALVPLGITGRVWRVSRKYSFIYHNTLNASIC